MDGQDRVLSVNFSWKGEPKPVTSIFVGTSPEFEFALYSLAFLCGAERTNVLIDGYDLCIRAYRWGMWGGARW